MTNTGYYGKIKKLKINKNPVFPYMFLNTLKGGWFFMKERFRQFMIGRYGTDELNNFITVITFIVIIISLFIDSKFSIFATLLLILVYFRMFSKNFVQRRAENAAYLKIKYKLTGGFSKQAREQRKNFHIYKCPQCKQKIRIPRGKGKIMITCPKCKHEFIKRS